VDRFFRDGITKFFKTFFFIIMILKVRF